MEVRVTIRGGFCSVQNCSSSTPFRAASVELQENGSTNQRLSSADLENCFHCTAKCASAAAFANGTKCSAKRITSSFGTVRRQLPSRTQRRSVSRLRLRLSQTN